MINIIIDTLLGADMSKYIHYCEMCKRELSDTRNALSLHIHNAHDISKEEYYQTYIDSRTACKECGAELAFRNIQTGYADYCRKCTVKIKCWSGERGERRRQLHRDLIEQRGGGAALGGAGKRKGSKNKNPYPMSDAVMDRIEKSRTVPRDYNRSEEKIEKQRTAWANKTPDEMQDILNKRDKSFLANVNQDRSEVAPISEQGDLNLKIMFNVL